MPVKNLMMSAFGFEDNQDVQLRKVTITPAIAKEFLGSSRGNRAIKSSRVAQYRDNMLNNTFPVTFEAIGFDFNFRLCNGHHRLLAIVQAGIPVEMLVGINGSDASFEYTDTGANRSKSDQISMFSGLDVVCETSKRTITLCNFLIRNYIDASGTSNLTTLKEVIVAHQHSIKFVADVYPCNLRGLSGSGVKGAIACAYPHVNTEKLAQFAAVLNLGVLKQVSGQSNAALLLRQVLTEGKHRKMAEKFGLTSDDFSLQRFNYHLASRAIAAHMRGVDIARHQSGYTLTEAGKAVIPPHYYTTNLL